MKIDLTTHALRIAIEESLGHKGKYGFLTNVFVRLASDGYTQSEQDLAVRELIGGDFITTDSSAPSRYLISPELQTRIATGECPDKIAESLRPKPAEAGRFQSADAKRRAAYGPTGTGGYYLVYAQAGKHPFTHPRAHDSLSLFDSCEYGGAQPAHDAAVAWVVGQEV